MWLQPGISRPLCTGAAGGGGGLHVPASSTQVYSLHARGLSPSCGARIGPALLPLAGLDSGASCRRRPRLVLWLAVAPSGSWAPGHCLDPQLRLCPKELPRGINDKSHVETTWPFQCCVGWGAEGGGWGLSTGSSSPASWAAPEKAQRCPLDTVTNEHRPPAGARRLRFSQAPEAALGEAGVWLSPCWGSQPSCKALWQVLQEELVSLLFQRGWERGALNAPVLHNLSWEAVGQGLAGRELHQHPAAGEAPRSHLYRFPMVLKTGVGYGAAPTQLRTLSPCLLGWR
ncbi:unnamed protein product [Lepidochelys kempii]